MEFKRKKCNFVILNKTYILAIIILASIVLISSIYDAIRGYIDGFVLTRYIILLVLSVLIFTSCLILFQNLDVIWSNKHLDLDIIDVKKDRIILNTFYYNKKEIMINDIKDIKYSNDDLIIETKRHCIELKHFADSIDAYNKLFNIVTRRTGN